MGQRSAENAGSGPECPLPSVEAKDSAGCPSATDFRTENGLVLITRCRLAVGHGGRHNDKRTKRWTDDQQTWRVTPPTSTAGSTDG